MVAGDAVVLCLRRSSEDRIQSLLPLLLIDDLKTRYVVTHCRHELRPVRSSRMLRADVEDRTLLLCALGLP